MIGGSGRVFERVDSGAQRFGETELFRWSRAAGAQRAFDLIIRNGAKPLQKPADMFNPDIVGEVRHVALVAE